MSPSTRKRPKNRVLSKKQDEILQDKIKQPTSKLIERNRLKMVLRNLSLLKLFKSSNRRIQELYSLARSCWNSVFRRSKTVHISSGDNDACEKEKENNGKQEETKSLEKTLKCKKAEATEEPKTRCEERKPKERAEKSPVAGPHKEKLMEPGVLRVSKGRGLRVGARKRWSHKRGSKAIFLKTCHHRNSMGDMKQLNEADQLVWFEGLPTRIRLPGPRVMCRPSTLRWVKRSCTRVCSASL